MQPRRLGPYSKTGVKLAVSTPTAHFEWRLFCSVLQLKRFTYSQHARGKIETVVVRVDVGKAPRTQSALQHSNLKSWQRQVWTRHGAMSSADHIETQAPTPAQATPTAHFE